MNILSWNVNGIRSIQRKDLFQGLFQPGFGEFYGLEGKKLDIIGLQETKAVYSELDNLFFPEGYNVYHNSATEKKGYSGTVLLVSKDIDSKPVPVDVTYETLNTEGRVVAIELAEFILINCYFPNGGGKPERLEYKLKFYEEFRRFCKDLSLKYKKSVIFLGDLNIAHEPIDLARPKENEKHVGFLPIERQMLDTVLKDGFLDIYREKYPDKVAYTWWDMKTRSRDRDIGWRIDAFYVQKGLEGKIEDVFILKEVKGSDHCPVLLVVNA